ncbi:sigma-E factor negative regulatory protein [Thalassotalea sp. PLHSN55]|uniref:sigma-E factor negative regulatory protein n=1 Tax=Thalassotalea sp. PLHSN55 TaxID=3435888 RepID=UPI003F878F1C
MSESKFETVSSLVDNYQQNEAQLDEILKDEQLSETWDRYHLIGDVMRDEVPQTMQFDIAAQIADAIADEPTVLAPAPKAGFVETVKAKVVQFSKPVGQMAIAASAAGLMIFGVQQNVAENDVVTPNQIVQTNPLGGFAEPVSFNYQQTSAASQKQSLAEQQRRFQALLSDHQQQVKLHAQMQAAAQEKVEDATQ